MKDNPVVITGAAIVTALGHTVSETWENLLAGRHGIRPIHGFDAAGFPCKVAAQVQGLDAASLDIHERSARIMDLHSYMLMKCASDAFAQARLNTARIPDEDIGLFVGMGMVDFRIDDLVPATLASMDDSGRVDLNKFYARGHQEIYPLITLYMLNNISVCQVAILLNIRGENAVFSPHAESGAQAVVEAVKTLEDGTAKAVLTGGVSEKVSPYSFARAHLQGVLDSRKEPDGGHCRPFSAQREGITLGEGCGMLSLELRSSAVDRGVPYSAAVTGFGHAFQAEDAAPAPTRKAIVQAMKSALEVAELSPPDIDVLIAHGDGTLAGDGNEISAIHEVFETCLNKLMVYSSKGALGHLLAGAPAVDAILGLCILCHGSIPATLHSDSLDKNVEFQVVRSRPLNTLARRTMVNSRSFEGQCSSLIIESVH